MAALGRVGLDVRVIGSKEGVTGVPNYVLHLARYLVERGNSLLFSDVAVPAVPCQVVRSIPKIPWQQVALPLAATKMKTRVFHGPAFSLPVWGNFRKVVTIHDVAYARNRDWMKDSVYDYLKWMVPLSLKVADAVIVPTRQVKQDLLEVHSRFVKEEKVFVIPMGSDFVLNVAGVYAASRTLPRQYILHVGTIEPRKNLETLIRAFSELARHTRFPHALVLAGSIGWKNDAVVRAIKESPVRHRIFRVGYVDNRTLEQLYRGADLYVQPSFYEGFGMSTLDAYCLGVPIVSTRTGWASEISDIRVHLVAHATDVSEMAAAMIRTLEAPPCQKSPATAAGMLWSWDRTIRDHEMLYTQLAQTPSL